MRFLFKVNKYLKLKYILTLLIIPSIIVNLIFLTSYTYFSHSYALSYQQVTNQNPHDIFSLKSAELINFSFYDQSLLFTEYNLENISYIYGYQTQVTLNNHNSSFFIFFVQDDLLFQQNIWGRINNSELVMSFTLSQELGITPIANQEFNLEIKNNISSIDVPSSIMSVNTIFGDYMLEVLADQMEYSFADSLEQIPIMVLSINLLKKQPLLQNLFVKQAETDYFYCLYYTIKENFFIERSPSQAYFDGLQQRQRIKGYIENIYEISLNQINSRYNLYNRLNAIHGFDMLNDYIVPILFFIHGFAAGLLLLNIGGDYLTSKLRPILRIYIERGGKKSDFAKKILPSIIISIVVSFIVTILVFFAVYKLIIPIDLNIKIRYEQIIYVAIASNAIILLIFVRHIIRYIEEFYTHEVSYNETKKHIKQKSSKAIQIFSISLIDTIVVILISNVVITDYEEFFISNPLFLVSLFIIISLFWLLALTDLVLKLSKKISNKFLSHLKLGSYIKKLLNSISLKKIKMLRIFVLIFFIITLVSLTNDTINHRLHLEVEKNTIVGSSISFDEKYYSVYEENLIILSENQIECRELKASLSYTKSNIEYEYSFPLFIFSSLNFSSFLSLLEENDKSINFNLSSHNNHFFISEKIVKIKGEQDTLKFDVNSNTFTYLINDTVKFLPILSLIAHQTQFREIRDAFAILVYPEDQTQAFESENCSIISMNNFENDTLRRQFITNVEYFNSIGINFEIIENSITQSEFMITNYITGEGNIFKFELIHKYSIILLVLLILCCFYLLGFSIYDFHSSTIKSTTIFISRGVSLEKMIILSFVISICLSLIHIIIPFLLATLLISLYCIFFSIGNYIPYYPSISSLTLLILLGLIVLVISIIGISGILFFLNIRKKLDKFISEQDIQKGDGLEEV